VTERWPFWLRGGVLTILACSLLAGVFLPVFTDEIGWRFQERAAFDGVDKMFSDVCGANTLAQPPFFMMPLRWYSAVFNAAFASPFYVRVSGILYALVWLVLLVRLVSRITPDRRDRAFLCIAGAGLMSLGTMPLLMVWSRPEQPVLLAATASFLVALADHADFTRPSSTAQAWRRSLGILLLSCLAVSYHLKGLFIVPFFIACLVVSCRGPVARWPRLVCGGAMVAMTALAASYWQHRFACPDHPLLAAFYAQHSLGASIGKVDSVRDAALFAAQALRNTAVFPFVQLSVPQPLPMASWLPAHQIGPVAAAAWSWLISGLWGGMLAVLAVAIYAGLARARRERTMEPHVLLAMVLLVCTLGWMSTVLIRNVYEAKMVLPLLALVITSMLAVVLAKPGLRGPATVLCGVLAVAAMVSPVALALTYGRSLDPARHGRAFIESQPVSLPVFGYETTRRQILAAGRLCGIAPDGPARGLMVDDLTYFAYMRTRLPQHQLGVTGMWSGRMADPVAYLRQKASDGIIVGCRHLPPRLRAKAKRVEEFCCLGPPDWGGL
jgi:hypothetical protein